MDTHSAIGEGNIDFIPVLRALERTGATAVLEMKDFRRLRKGTIDANGTSEHRLEKEGFCCAPGTGNITLPSPWYRDREHIGGEPVRCIRRGRQRREDIDIDAPHLPVAAQVVFREPLLVVIEREPVTELVGLLLVPGNGADNSPYRGG